MSRTFRGFSENKNESLLRKTFRKPKSGARIIRDTNEFPEDGQLWQDTGFQGYRPEGVENHQPKKKPRGGELTVEEKSKNQSISKVRVKVEHHISGIKRCKIVVHKLQNHLAHYADEVMETACGLHNFRVSNRQKKGVKA